MFANCRAGLQAFLYFNPVIDFKIFYSGNSHSPLTISNFNFQQQFEL